MKTRLTLLALIAAGIEAGVCASTNVSAQLATRLFAKQQTVRLGDPIIVSVRVTNQAAQAAEVDRNATAFNSFQITDSEGKALPYIGDDGQVAMSRADVQPLSAVTIADTLDLTDKYLFRKPGRYSVRFISKWSGLSESPAIPIEVTAGRLSNFDELVVSLFEMCPGGFHLVKDERGEVTPFGRSRVRGWSLHLCHNHMRGEAVLLWFTKEEAKVDPHQKPRGKLEYLGRARGLFVYESVGQNTPPLWPTATEDISHALQITKL